MCGYCADCARVKGQIRPGDQDGSDAAGAANDSVCAGGRNGVTLEEGCLSTGLSILNEKFVLIQVVHVGRWQNVCYNELNGYKEQMQTCHSLFRRRLLSDY